MSLFGALDLETVAECPEKGTYPATLKSFKFFKSQNENDFLSLVFTIDHPLFPNYESKRLLRIYPDLDVSTLDEDELAQVNKNARTFRDWMRALGVPELELGNPDLTDYTGLTGSAYGYEADKWNEEGKEWKIHSFKKD